MTSYWYKAFHKSGHISKGTLSARNVGHLEKILMSQNKELVRAHKLLTFSFFRRKPSLILLIEVCTQLQSLLQANVLLLDALKSIHKELPPSLLKQVLEETHMGIAHGQSFSSCLKNYAPLFDSTFVTLLESGEETGDLVQALDSLIKHLKWMETLHSLAQKSLIYPFLLLGVIAATCGILMTTLVPQLEDLLVTLDVEKPAMTEALIKGSSFMREFWLHGIVCMGILIFLNHLLKSLSQTYAIWSSRLTLFIPLYGGLHQSFMLMRYFHILWSLLSAHIDLLKALKIASNSVPNLFLKTRFVHLEYAIQQGQSLYQSLNEVQGIPSFIKRMLHVGEQSGTLTKSLADILYFYERHLEHRTSQLLKLLEPSLLILMGLLIAWIALALFYPLYDTLTYIDF